MRFYQCGLIFFRCFIPNNRSHNNWTDLVCWNRLSIQISLRINIHEYRHHDHERHHMWLKFGCGWSRKKNNSFSQFDCIEMFLGRTLHFRDCFDRLICKKGLRGWNLKCIKSIDSTCHRWTSTNLDNSLRMQKIAINVNNNRKKLRYSVLHINCYSD